MMAYKYGIKTDVKESISQAPVSTESCLVFFGNPYNSAAESGKAIRCNNYKEYLNKFHSGSTPTKELSLDIAAKLALSTVDHVWIVNCASSGSTTEVANNKIQNALEPALNSIVLNSSERPNIICIPALNERGATNRADLLAELARLCHGGICGRYSAFALVDVDQSDSQVDSNGNADAEHITKVCTDGYIKNCWGYTILERDEDGAPSAMCNASIIGAIKLAEQDGRNTGGVPYRSLGNLLCNNVKGLCIRYVSSDQTHTEEINGVQDNITEVVKKGIDSFINSGNSQWRTWGDHTSAFIDGGVFDELYRFDSTVRVMIHLANRFIDKWQNVIDSPMTLQLRNDILAEETNYLNYCLSIGALIGDPVCEFKPTENITDTLQQGQFYFTNIYTVVIPAKFVQMNLQWTNAGLSAYIEQ